MVEDRLSQRALGPTTVEGRSFECASIASCSESESIVIQDAFYAVRMSRVRIRAPACGMLSKCRLLKVSTPIELYLVFGPTQTW